MANVTYDALWQQAMGELSEQLHVEGAEDDENLEAEGLPKLIWSSGIHPIAMSRFHKDLRKPFPGNMYTWMISLLT
eukprot:scaffold5903_cov165-Ochromonas_danica.AAC.10